MNKFIVTIGLLISLFNMTVYGDTLNVFTNDGKLLTTNESDQFEVKSHDRGFLVNSFKRIKKGNHSKLVKTRTIVVTSGYFIIDISLKNKKKH